MQNGYRDSELQIRMNIFNALPGTDSIDTDSAAALSGLNPDAFNHIPGYCRVQAMEAIAHVRRMEEQNIFRPGVYYVVLTDLCGATASAEKLGMDLNMRRVESFIIACVESLGRAQPENYAHFLKVVGDAGLFLFSSFLDVYQWWSINQTSLDFYSQQWEYDLKPEERDVFRLRSKTVFHVGEVAYSGKSDPVSAAVNQVFKIEKMFTAGQLGCTDIGQQVASPYFRKLGLSPSKGASVQLPVTESMTDTWLISSRQEG